MKFISLTKFNPQLYLEQIQSQKVTKLLLVPPLASFLVNHPMVDNYDISSIKDILCGAAPLPLKIETLLTTK